FSVHRLQLEHLPFHRRYLPMREGNILLVVLAVCVASTGTTVAASAKSRHLRLQYSSENGKYDRPLPNYNRNVGFDSIEAEGEERAVNFSGVKEWPKALFRNWPQILLGTRDKKIPEGIAYDFAPKTIKAMLKRKSTRSEMFKRWDNYRMEDIKLKIGEAEMNNDAVAKLLVNYVQDHRVYRQRWRNVD
ncbi:hypothetical protein F444_20614, partial [Phytophthora nicotianae P1976]